MKKIVFLTSSRADYGILRPLIKTLQQEDSFHPQIIVFGSHLSQIFGLTIEDIRKDQIEIIEEIQTLPSGDHTSDIIHSIGTTITSFTPVFQKIQDATDLIICLGDRYEMMAAVIAASHFETPIAHLHGGETTLGAMDNRYRHVISLNSKYHFCSAQKHLERLVNLLDTDADIYNVGALGIDNLIDFNPLPLYEMKTTFGIDFQLPTLLVVYHPETEQHNLNNQKLQNLIDALTILNKDYQIVINMPNADVTGLMAREKLNNYVRSSQSVYGIEHFGSKGYFSAISYSKALIGNSSSGIIEAASLSTRVVNIGDRQKGRAQSANTQNVPFESKVIVDATLTSIASGSYNGDNIYQSQSGATAIEIVSILKSIFCDS